MLTIAKIAWWDKDDEEEKKMMEFRLDEEVDRRYFLKVIFFINFLNNMMAVLELLH
jgi:hypothetical protein